MNVTKIAWERINEELLSARVKAEDELRQNRYKIKKLVEEQQTLKKKVQKYVELLRLTKWD